MPERALDYSPCGWTIDKSSGATVKLNNLYPLSAQSSLEIKTNSGEYASVYQTYYGNYPKFQDMVLSAFVNVPNNSSALDSNSTGNISLVLEALYTDGTIGRSLANIPLSTTESGYLESNLTGTNTSVSISYWKKIETTLNLNKPASLFKCFINSNYSNSTSNILFYTDCIQLEEGNKSSRWKKRAQDTTPWIYVDDNYIPAEYNVYSNNTSQYQYREIVLMSDLINI